MKVMMTYNIPGTLRREVVVEAQMAMCNHKYEKLLHMCGKNRVP